MDDPLIALKRRLSERYLGLEGIHGLGVNQAAGTVRVHLEPRDTPAQQELLREIEREAEPFEVEIVREERPLLT